MPQGRIILKSIGQSKKMLKLKTDGARLLYTWLIPYVDINGCFSGDAQVIKGQVFTRLKHSIKIIESFLIDLEDAGLIIRYETDGDIFLIIPDFADRQPSLKPEKEAKPTIPLPTPDQLQSKSGVTPSISKGKKSKIEVKERKVKYLKYVFMTQEEHKKLIDKLGEERTEEMISALNNYIGSKGKQYKSHYHTILTWVRMEKDKNKKGSKLLWHTKNSRKDTILL